MLKAYCNLSEVSDDKVDISHTHHLIKSEGTPIKVRAHSKDLAKQSV